MATVSENRGARIDFTALDNLWTIDADVSVFVQNDVAAYSTIAGSRLTNNGVVFAAYVPSLGNGAVSLQGNGATIANNAGASITGHDGGISVNGNGVDIINRGAVTGAREFGILFGSASDNVDLDNSGNIYGGEQGLWILSQVDGGIVVNAGVIRSGGIGISMSAPVTTTVTNTGDGVIRGREKAIEINFGAISLLNEGEIRGLVHGNIQSGNDRVENRGSIVGEVRLGAGDDTFVFAGGSQGEVSGDSGTDTFVFMRKFAPKKAGVPTIADFTPGEDSIGMSKALFKGIGKAGPLKDKAFAFGGKARDADDRILYDSSTGECRFDKDGKGGSKAKLFAVLDGSPDIDIGDFLVLA